MTFSFRLLVLSALASVAMCAGAQVLGDPTQPPAGGGALADAAQAPAGPVLQAIVLEPHRKFAVINGNTVRLGGEFEGARLTRITVSEVTLKNGTETTVLKLFPDVTKTPSAEGRKTKRVQPAQESPR
jgi:MSHA biogenesis protein MshK